MTTLTLLKLTRAGQQLNPRDLHTVLCWAFPHDEVRLLWTRPRPETLLVQADTGPDPDRLIGLIETHQCTDPQHVWPVGAAVTLSGVLNPTTGNSGHRPDGTRRSGKKPVPAENLAVWLEPRLHGLTATRVTAENLPSSRVTKPNGHTVNLARVAVRVTGTVTDAEALAGMLAAGLGDGRAYGCGLLIARSAA